MNNTATIEKMNSMKLFGMARAFLESHEVRMKNKITPDEMLAFLIDAEWDERYNRKLARRIAAARFRFRARIEEVNTSSSRNIDKNKLMRFTDAGWIRNAENIIITGATGVGKSFLASAIGHHVCINGFNCMYFNCLKLFSNLKTGKADGSYSKEIKKIKSQDLIILDDFGLSPFDKDSRLMLLEIIEDRIGISSTIVSTQLPVKQWFDVIGDQTIADAFIDRLIHSSHKINLKGDSMRKNSGNFLPLD
jgi:DNA replication protein DnaC